jgi:P4 family phage/plasmid primase-like protien
VAVRNGFVVLEGGQPVLRPHDPDHRAQHALAVDYDPAATAPRFARYFAEVFQGQPDVDERVQAIEEWIGATLFGAITKHALCLIMYGTGGNNGKSVLLHVLRALFPTAAVESISPQQWGNVFHLAKLAGCMLNVVSELPDTDLAAGETFKAVVAGDAVNAAHKNRDPFTFAPTAGHLFACNGLPGTQDHSGGFYRRWLALTFERQFRDDERELDLRETLVRDELPGIVARVIAAAGRLERRGCFVVPATAAAAKEQWRVDSDQVAQFLADRDALAGLWAASERRRVEKGRPVTAARWTKADPLYAAYAVWAKAHGQGVLSSTKFGVRAKTLLGAEGAGWKRSSHAIWYRLPDVAGQPAEDDPPEDPPPKPPPDESAGFNPTPNTNPTRATPREDTSMQGMQGMQGSEIPYAGAGACDVSNYPTHPTHPTQPNLFNGLRVEGTTANPPSPTPTVAGRRKVARI